MKLLNILGAVIAAHVAVLVLAVAIPGCRSTRTANPATDTAPSTAYSAPESTRSSNFKSAPELSDRDLNPPLAGQPPPLFDPNAPAVSSGASSRYSPTRPGTVVASSIQTSVDPVPVTPAATYTVQRGDNLWSLAKKNNITVRELAAANNLPADSGLRLGQELVIPGKAPAPLPSSNPAAVSTEAPPTTYTIKSGDNLASIARKHGTTVAQLKAFNNLRGDMVRAGDKLSIPDSATTAGSTVATSVSAPVAEAPKSNMGSKTDHRHVVAPGESLTVIAGLYGVKVGDLIVANMIRDPSLIRAGQELVIPGVPAQLPATAAVKTPATVPPSASRTTTPSAAALSSSDDLDAGLDTTLDNVPVISVENAPMLDDDDAPVQTITIGGGNSGESQPPLFR